MRLATSGCRDTIRVDQPGRRPRPPFRISKASARCGPSPSRAAYRSAAYSLRRLTAASASGQITAAAATPVKATTTVHRCCCTAWTIATTTPATTTSVSNRRGCRCANDNASTMTTRDSTRHGAESHIVTNANFVARVSTCPISCARIATRCATPSLRA